MHSTINLSFKVLLAATWALTLIACSLENQSAHANNTTYSMEDYAKVQKIDAHVHANNADAAFIQQAQQDNFKLLTINVDYPDFPTIKLQQDIALELTQKYPETIVFAATFSMNNWAQDDFQSQVIKHLNNAISQGAVAVKVWKNIGMAFRNEEQQLVMIDDAGLGPIFSHLTDVKVPLIGHQGEPHNCWLPIAEMSVNNDKQYFAAHPEYHMYLHPDMPSYQQQISARNNLLNKHPNLQFVGAHLGSLEWSVDAMSEFLETYPTASLDMAARMGQVQAQSVKDLDKVRQFFIDYQDRIVYATDLTHSPDVDSVEFKSSADKKWREDWRYLNTDSELSVPEVDGVVRGLALPKTVIDKIYRSNAVRIFKLH